MIYENVKRIAEEKHVSIRALEIQAELANGTISKWQSCSPSVKNLQAVAKALEVSMDELLEE